MTTPQIVEQILENRDLVNKMAETINENRSKHVRSDADKMAPPSDATADDAQQVRSAGDVAKDARTALPCDIQMALL